jgi:hypothetical protein
MRKLLLLFCVNEDIPGHYKNLIGRIIKKQNYTKSEKIYTLNTLGYIWDKAKENIEVPKITKVILIRRLHKFLFGKFDN